MRNRITAILASFGVLLAILVGGPAATGQDQALAIGERVNVSSTSQHGTTVKVIKSDGTVTKIGVLPGGKISSTARLDSWYLPSGRCALFSVNGGDYIGRRGSAFNPWVWIPPGSSVGIYIYTC